VDEENRMKVTIEKYLRKKVNEISKQKSTSNPSPNIEALISQWNEFKKSGI
jgi:hypothetical protein